MKIGQSDFIDRYTDEMVKIFSVTNPEWDEEDVRKIIREMIDKDISVPAFILDTSNFFSNFSSIVSPSGVLNASVDTRGTKGVPSSSFNILIGYFAIFHSSFFKLFFSTYNK